jgi:hypothetical protein
MEKEVVARARSTDQNDRTLLEIRPAKGMVREPTMGTKIVKRMMFCMLFVMIFKDYYNKKMAIVKGKGAPGGKCPEITCRPSFSSRCACFFAGDAV